MHPLSFRGLAFAFGFVFGFAFAFAFAFVFAFAFALVFAFALGAISVRSWANISHLWPSPLEILLKYSLIRPGGMREAVE